MKRTCVALVALAIAGVASARVVMVPTVPRTCSSGTTWEQVGKCIGRFGKVTLQREASNVKLVRIAGESGFRVSGLYLYAHVGPVWKLAGMFESDAVEIASFERVTIAKHTGYRFDLGMVTPAGNALDDEVAGPAVLQQQLAVFCSGAGYRCTAIVTSCDLLVDGRSRASFRGTLTIQGDTALVLGDRSRASAFCQTPASQSLDWAGLDNIDF